MRSASTLMPMSLPRCARRDWSMRSRRAFFSRSAMSACNCSGVQRPWHSFLASSWAVSRAFSYSEWVMISLLTRAMISSTVLPLSGLADFGGTGFAGFSILGSGAAIPGFSRTGGPAGLGWGSWGFSCAANDRPTTGKTAQSATIKTSFLINASPVSLALPMKAEQYVSQDLRDGLPPLHFHPKDAAGIEFDAGAGAHHGDQPGRVQGRFRMESYGQTGSLAFHGGDTQALTHGFEDGVLQKVFYGRGGCAKAVLKFLADVLFLLFGGNGGDAFVGAETEIFAGDVVLGDAHVKAQTQGGTQIGSDFLTFEFGNGALEHL